MTASDQQHLLRRNAPAEPPAVDAHLLQQLADAHGVGTSFQGWDGLPHAVSLETLTKVLGALGVPAHTDEQIRAGLAEALSAAVVWPVRSNAGFLVTALEHPDFVAGTVDTGLIAREGDALMPPAEPSVEALAAT